MDAIVSLAPPLAAALVDLDATYFVQMTMFLVLYILLSQVFFKPYVRRLRLRDQAGHGLRERAKDALRRAKELDEDAERRLTGAKQAAVLERRRLAEDGVALRDGIVTKERERAATFLSRLRDRGDSFTYRAQVPVGPSDLRSWADDVLATFRLIATARRGGTGWPKNAAACHVPPCPFQALCSNRHHLFFGEDDAPFKPGGPGWTAGLLWCDRDGPTRRATWAI